MRKAFGMLCLVLALSLSIGSATFGKENPSDARISSAYKKDKDRDAKLKEKTGKATEFRERFASRQQTIKERKEGLAPGTHLGGKVKPGRPLGQEKAAAQYGLPKKNAEVRSVWEVKKETPRKTGKVIGGTPGKGEVVIKKRIPPGNRVSSKPTEKSKNK